MGQEKEVWYEEKGEIGGFLLSSGRRGVLKLRHVKRGDREKGGNRR